MKHLLSTKDLSRDDAIAILDLGQRRFADRPRRREVPRREDQLEPRSHRLRREAERLDQSLVTFWDFGS